jgi:hypothetical protein
VLAAVQRGQRFMAGRRGTRRDADLGLNWSTDEADIEASAGRSELADELAG